MGLGTNQMIKSFSFPKEEVGLFEDFKAVAKDRGVSCSEQMRQAMTLFLEDYRGNVVDEANRSAPEEQEIENPANPASSVLLQQLEAQETLEAPSMHLVDACIENDEMVPVASPQKDEVEAQTFEGFSHFDPISPGLAVAHEVMKASAAAVDSNKAESSSTQMFVASEPTHLGSESSDELAPDSGVSTDLINSASMNPAAEESMFPMTPAADNSVERDDSSTE